MVELLVNTDGRAAPSLIVRKHLENQARLTHQVRWLTRAQGPGVVRLHDVGPRATHYSTHFGGGLTLAAAAIDPATTVPILDQVWAALERLHRLGLAHGALSADHVVVGVGGPLLLSPGGPVGVDRRSDIDGFGRMLGSLADVWSAEASAEPSLVSRWRTVGRHLADLAATPQTPVEDRLITGAEVRRLLAELGPAGSSGRRSAVARLRRRRRYGSDRGRRDGRRPSRS